MNSANIKMIIPITLGTALEWAEYTFFAYMIDLLSKQFFPIDDPELARLKTYGIFATSYFMRPLGALVFGAIGDKLGRKPALVSSMLLMGLATTAIGCLPTSPNMVSLSAVLLIFCRLLQGLAVAGEFNGSAVFMLEHSHSRPFLTGSLTPFAASLGMSFGALSAMLVSMPNAPDFAWRIPFLASGFLGIVALYLRRKIPETPIFQQSVSSHKTKENLAQSQPLFAWVSTAAMALFITVFIYIGNIYYKILMIKSGINTNIAAQIVTFGQVLSAILIFAFGFLADYSNGKKICVLGLVAAIFLGPLILAFGQSRDLLYCILGQVCYAIINGLVSATFMTLLVKQFPAGTRYTGNSFAWNVPAAIFGGTALMTADILINQFGFMGVGLYISFASLIALLGTIMPSFKLANKITYAHSNTFPPRG